MGGMVGWVKGMRMAMVASAIMVGRKVGDEGRGGSWLEGHRDATAVSVMGFPLSPTADDKTRWHTRNGMARMPGVAPDLG